MCRLQTIYQFLLLTVRRSGFYWQTDPYKSYNNRNGRQQNNYAYNIYVLNVNNRSFLDILWFDNDALNYVK